MINCERERQIPSRWSDLIEKLKLALGFFGSCVREYLSECVPPVIDGTLQEYQSSPQQYSL